MEQAAGNASGSVRKAGETVSQFDKRAAKTEKTLSSWAKEKYEVTLEAMDKISPLISVIGGGIKGIAGKTWGVTMKAVDLITSPVRGIINLLKNPVFQVGAVLGVSIGLKDTIDTYKDFEAAMSRVEAISGATGSEVAKLTNKAKEMGATTKFTATESAEAFNYMAMAGWKTEDMLGGIEGILSLAAASGEDLATTSDIVTDALTAFNMKASDAGRFSDVLAAAASNANTTVSGMGETFKYAGSMAGSLGYSIEDVALMTGLMANAGIKGTMAGTALNSIFTRLSTNTHGAADAISKLGIEFFTADGTARKLSDVMGELRTATADMSPQQKSVLANTIAGTQAQKGLLAVLNASTQDYDKLAKAIENADGAAAGMSDTMMDNLQGSITLLQSAVDGVKISFGERLSPYVRGLADWLTDQMPDIEQGLDHLMDWVETKVDQAKRKFDEIAGAKEWKEADFFGKIEIAWDEFIAEPFLDWWNSAGKAKFAEFAGDIGAGIGTGLKTGVMTLLGIDLGETLDEGVSIGASFAKGFSEGFDFDTISGKLFQGFGNLLTSAGKLLPGGESAGLSSVLSAVLLGKMASPLISMGKGAFHIGKGLFGTNAATGTSLIGSLVGTTGNQMVQGTGLLNILANAGYSLTGGSATAGGYFGAGTAMSGGAAAAVGAAGITGGAVAGATLISSALDAYKAIRSDNLEESKSYGESAAWKAGGVATGAAAGAAIGSVIPGFGTAVGALVGAGVGGIAGWVKGNKVKEEYQENVEQMREEAQKAQKVFEATGMAIEDVTFKNEALSKAMNDSEVSASQFALMFQEECADVAKRAFGDISLSLAEVKKLAGDIAFGDMAEGLGGFSKAAEDTRSSLAALESSVSSLKKENWKVSLGMDLSETDQEEYKGAVESFLNASQAYIEDNHYQATVALRLLAGGEADISGLDRYYSGLRGKLENLGAKLTDQMKISLEDGVITLNETAELENLQSQISEITGRLTEAKTDAQMQALRIKYSGAALDMDSFNALQEELQANTESMSEQYENALTLRLTDLNLQLADGTITKSEYDAAFAEATEGYYARIDELRARVVDFNLESIADAWGDSLEGILPEIEGSTVEKLAQALSLAMSAHPDLSAWTAEDVIGWMGLDKLDLDTAEQTAIAAELIQTAFAVPEGLKGTIIQDIRDEMPTMEEILLEKGPISTEYYEQFVAEWQEAGTAYGDALNSGASTSLLSGSPLLRTGLQTALDTATASPFTISPAVNVMPNYKIAAPSFPSASQRFSGHAAGGYVSGGPQLSWLAEEGYGEFIIPTNPSRRTRALELYEQAGAVLGVSGHADGGYIGGRIPRDLAGGYLSLDTGRNAPADENEDAGGINGWEMPEVYKPLPMETGGDTGGLSIQIDVNMSPEFTIHGSGQSEEGMAWAIRRLMREMADELGGEIAEKLEEVFSNMPLKEG